MSRPTRPRAAVRRSLLVLCGCLLGATTAHATKYAGEFLKIPVGARAVGMGGAFTAVADDATAPWWNPAGMIYLPYREVIPQHAEKFGKLVNHDYLGVVLPLGGPSGKQSALGVGLVRLAVDEIPITPRPGDLRPGIDFQDYGPDNDESTPDPGQGNGVWDPGERILNIDLFRASSADMAMLLSYARHNGPHWAFGGSVKFVRQSIPDTIPGQHVTSFGAGLDAGLLYMPMDAATIGITVRDLTTTWLSWSNGTRELVVPTIDTGVAFNFFPADQHALTWAVDLGWGFQHRRLDSQLKLGSVTADVRTGLEYWYKSTFALRTGANAKDLTFGAGVRYKHLGVDYAAALHRFFASDESDFPDDQDLDTTHLVSASFSW
ncbi:MAG: hypothetical protein AAB290_02265 [Candidatus Eisenbacteria bacterium]